MKQSLIKIIPNNNMFFSIIIKFSLGATVGHFISVSPFISLAYETPWTVKFYISWCVCLSVPVCVCYPDLHAVF